MRITLDQKKSKDYFYDIQKNVDAIIADGIELLSCNQDSRSRLLRSSIDRDSQDVHNFIYELRHFGLVSERKNLFTKLKFYLLNKRSGFKLKVDPFAYHHIISILTYLR